MSGHYAYYIGLSGLSAEGLRWLCDRCDKLKDKFKVEYMPYSTSKIGIYGEEFLLSETVDEPDILDMLKEYLGLFNPGGCISFTWADQCDNLGALEVGQGIGGGCAVVTQEGYITETTDERLCQMEEDFTQDEE